MADEVKNTGPVCFHVRDSNSTVVRSGKRENTTESWKFINDYMAAHPTYTLFIHEDSIGIAGYVLPPVNATLDASSNIIKEPPPPKLNVGNKIKELRAACDKHITGGFYSNALNSEDSTIGEKYFYPSNVTDQLNLLHGSPVLCADSDRVWIERDHTDEQLLKVQTSFRTLRDGARTKLKLLEIETLVAKTQKDLDAIKWGRQ